MSKKSEQAAQHRGFVVLVASVAAVAGILFGFDTGVISGAILFIRKLFDLSPFMNGLVVSAVLIGALMGSGVSGRFADYFGRRNLLVITAVIFLLGTVGSALSVSVLELVISRIIVGLAIGVASFTAPLYISEISPPQYRGALVSLNQLAITVGIMLAYVVDAVFAQQGAWRWMLGMGVIPAFVLLFGMLFLPKSPRWLIRQGFNKLAKKTLQTIRRTENVDAELKDIQESIGEQGNWRLLLQKWVRPALVIGLGLAFFQQCTGINTIIYYAPTIFQIAGFKSDLVALLATSGVGAVNVLFTVISLFLIDRVGRRPLLIVGLIGMLISLLLLSIVFHFDTHTGMLRWFALGSMILYIMCFAISLGPIMWLMIAEIFPLEIRGLGSSLAVSASWGFNMIVALTFLTLVKSFGAQGAFFLYAMLSVFGVVFVITMIPETKGTTLEKIENNLRAGVRARDLGQQ